MRLEDSALWTRADSRRRSSSSGDRDVSAAWRPLSSAMSVSNQTVAPGSGVCERRWWRKDIMGAVTTRLLLLRKCKGRGDCSGEASRVLETFRGRQECLPHQD